MGNTINGRTPEEIKTRIDYCRNVKTAGDCMSCPYVEDADVCASDFMFDSFDYMEHLETELAKALKDVDMLGEQVVALDGAYNAMKRERDAAVLDLEMCCPCEVCTRSCKYDKVNVYSECADFEWRGVQEVE